MAIRQDFNQAFRDARNSGEKTFEFRGKTYTTELAKPSSKTEVGPHGPGSEDFLPDGPKMRSEEKDTSRVNKPDFVRKNYSMPGVRMGGEGEPAIVIGGGSSETSETPKKQMTRPTVTDPRERANLDADTSRPSGEGMKKGGMATKNKMQRVKKMAGGGAVRGYGLATKGRGRGKVC